MWPRRSRASRPEPSPPSPPPVPPPAAEPAGDRGDGRDAIVYFSGWIGNADTKSGLLATGLTVLGVASVQRLHDFVTSGPGTGWRDIGAGVLLGAALLAIGFSAGYLVLALVPRTSAPPSFSRYAFPAVARREPGFVPDLDPERQRAEAWVQARELAQIAAVKLRFFRLGMYAFVAGAVLFGLGALIAR